MYIIYIYIIVQAESVTHSLTPERYSVHAQPYITIYVAMTMKPVVTIAKYFPLYVYELSCKPTKNNGTALDAQKYINERSSI